MPAATAVRLAGSPLGMADIRLDRPVRTGTCHVNGGCLYRKELRHTKNIKTGPDPFSGTLFYIDPPYWGSETDDGKGLFSPGDFAKLADLLGSLRSRFILSLNDCPEVRTTFRAFTIEPIETTYTVGGGSKAKRAGELIITSGGNS